MSLVKFVGLALMLAVIIYTMKSVGGDFYIITIVVATLILMYYIIVEVTAVIGEVQNVFAKIKVPTEMLKLGIKVIGLSYMTEFSANITEQMSGKTLSDSVRLFGKISIFMVTLPLLKQFVEIFEGLL